MKKLLLLGLVSTLSLTLLAGCGNSTKEGNTSDAKYKVGMSTDSGTIDDKSFNQGTWEGIKQYEEENKNIETKYIQPVGEAKEDYLKAIGSLVNGGYKMIITPGFKFSAAIGEAQKEHTDTKFVIIDGQPQDDNFKSIDIEENCLSIYFTEQEPGFYSGVTAALTTKTGKVGFIGGMEVPAVQKFGWGFVSGVAYANKMYGTTCEVSQYQYQGTFNDVVAGKAMAGDYYNQGIDIIFCAAGGVGVGAIQEGKTRRQNNEDVWIIGVDSDQYAEGIYDGDKSCILTSALKNVQKAAYDAIDDEINEKFVGGKSVTLSTKEDAVKLPDSNPNMSDDATAKYKEVYAKVKDGSIVVPNSVESLTTYLTEMGYTSSISKY